MNRNQALQLLKEHVKSDQLYHHSLAVEGAMIAYAKHFGEDAVLWGNLGLLHDIDFEKYPEGHPAKAPELLEPAGLDKDFIDAVLSHGLDSREMRTDNMRKALSAVDQMSSFIVAVALMRPNGLEDLKGKSVKKKMKDKAFAKAVDRVLLESDREDLGVEFENHIDIIVQGLVEHEERLNQLGESLFK